MPGRASSRTAGSRRGGSVRARRCDRLERGGWFCSAWQAATIAAAAFAPRGIYQALLAEPLLPPT